MRRDRVRAVVPTKECVAGGTKFCCQIDRAADGHSGAVRDEQGRIRWRYGMRKSSGRGRGNPFNKPDFVVAEPDSTNEVVIRRASFIPSVFNIIKTGRVVGRIKMLSIFRNKYAVDIDGVDSWTFRMPLFTIRFFGDSREGVGIWVAVWPSMMQWNILIKAGVEEWPLLAALAFIHTEWWNYG